MRQFYVTAITAPGVESTISVAARSKEQARREVRRLNSEWHIIHVEDSAPSSFGTAFPDGELSRSALPVDEGAGDIS